MAHAVAGALPIGPGLPVVATLLDLAPWELPEQYQRSPAARFGQRLRAQLLRDAGCGPRRERRRGAGGDEPAADLRPSRVRVVPLAGDDAFAPFSMEGTGGRRRAAGALAAERERFGLPERYFVYPGRYDARQDLGTLLEALGRLAAAGRPARLGRGGALAAARLSS